MLQHAQWHAPFSNTKPSREKSFSFDKQSHNISKNIRYFNVVVADGKT
jgi:hypothetical protein